MTDHPKDPEQLDDDLRRISDAAAALPTLSPSRDLWPEIEARIGAEVIALKPTTAELPVAPRRPAPRPVVRLAIAASVLIAVTAGLTWRLARFSDPAQIVQADRSTTGNPADDDAAPFQAAAFERTVAEVDQEIATLRTIVRDRSGELDPNTLKVLDRNLKLIDDAIAESRRALAADPASRFLAERLARAYTSKLTLLRDVATLPARI